MVDYWHSQLTLEDLSSLRRRLVQRQAELEQQSKASIESRNPVDLDQSRVGRLSRMDALQVQAMQNALEYQRNQELNRIHFALKRIQDQEYGECIRCYDEIPKARLDFDPSLSTCVQCADAVLG